MKHRVSHVTERIVLGTSALLLSATSFTLSLLSVDAARELWPLFATGIALCGFLGILIR